MRAHYSSFFFFLSFPIFLLTVAIDGFPKAQTTTHRRVLHQPLFPDSSPPPDFSLTPPPPPPVDPSYSNPEDQPFFHESPTIPNSDQNQPPPSSSNVNSSIPEATQPSKPTKTVAIAISVGIVTLGMLSALAFFLYRHRGKHAGDSQKLVGGNNGDRFPEDSRVPPSSFLYIGTVEPSQTSVVEPKTVNGGSSSPYRKLNSIKMSDRYRPSPELQPLPPLPKPLVAKSLSPSSSSDDENHETAFHTPQGSSVVSNEEGYGQSVNHVSSATVKSDKNSNFSVPHSKRTSPKSRLSVSSSKVGQSPVPPSPPPPPPTSPFQQPQPQISSKRPKFSKHPPPPNLALLQSLSNSSPNPQIVRKPGPPHPPPPPPPPAFPPLISKPRKVKPSERSVPSTPTPLSSKGVSWSATKSTSNSPPSSGLSNYVEQVHRSVSSSEKLEADDSEGVKPKLKPLHWDKVRATSERATVWDQLKSSSFQVNEDMMETLFGFNSANPASKEPARKTIFPSSMVTENRVLDPKKSQNIAILLRALNVTHDEVAEALSDGNPECLGPELLETLVKMAPTKEEEIKLRDYRGDISKLGSAERFLKAVLDIPFAFKRVEAMLYRANFDTEVNYLGKAFQTLEAASDELKNSRLFLKLLEAVLKTGNRMNVGTNRGDAKAFKLETLLKLVDVKGTDGKTTLLHFVVQEMIRSEGEGEGEGEGGDTINVNLPTKTGSNLKDQFKKQGLKIVAGLSRDLINVKKAAGMDSDVLSSYVSKLEMGLEKVRLVLQIGKPDVQATFFDSMNIFLKEAEEEIVQIKADEKKALWLVKGVTEYFHGDAAKEEAHPLRIFMIVKDFLSILDQVCKEVGRMQEVVVGSARSFRLQSSVSLPVLSRYNVRQDQSSDEESLSS